MTETTLTEQVREREPAALFVLWCDRVFHGMWMPPCPDCGARWFPDADPRGMWDLFRDHEPTCPG